MQHFLFHLRKRGYGYLHIFACFFLTDGGENGQGRGNWIRSGLIENIIMLKLQNSLQVQTFFQDPKRNTSNCLLLLLKRHKNVHTIPSSDKLLLCLRYRKWPKVLECMHRIEYADGKSAPPRITFDPSSNGLEKQTTHVVFHIPSTQLSNSWT